MLRNLFEVNGDALVYGGLAKNLLQWGQYAYTLPTGALHPTLIRLPGYPLLVALCFRLFGMENYYSVACVQIVLDLLSCLLLAGFARRAAPPALKGGAGLAALWLAALCPFTASYAITPLSESPTLFALSLAMWAMARFREEPRWRYALWFTTAITCAALLRPDGALAAIAFAPALVIGMRFGDGPGEIPLRRLARMAAVCVLLTLAPFAVWTARNWRAFHVFEPLAPRLAIDPGESPNLGWEHWVKSWCLEFASTFEIYWNVPGNKLDLSALPSRAFDTPAQYAETVALAADYNDNDDITPEMDARFERLAEERIAAKPLRYYVWLPLGRVADMWLRPRTENMDVDPDWWVYAHHPGETRLGWSYVGLNALYLLLGIAGLLMRPRFRWALLAYMLLRSALLVNIAAPEARYTLECFPMLFAAGGIALAWAAGRIYLSKPKALTGKG
ncbi:MAG: glycosyltransferase family 39 protein [Terracidiphilus sp.]